VLFILWQRKKADAGDVLDWHLKRIEEILQENTMRDHRQTRVQQWIF